MTDTVKDILTWLLPGGSIITALGFGFRQARLKGAHDEQIKQMKKTVDTIQGKCADHDTRLGEGAGNFKAITVTLEHISETTNRIETKLDKHLEAGK